jgi:hypothetical protein
MPVPCGCATACHCVVQGDGGTIGVTGTGGFDSPYVLSLLSSTPPGSPSNPLTAAAAARPVMVNAFWNTPTMPTKFGQFDVQLNPLGFLRQVTGVTAVATSTSSISASWPSVPNAAAYQVVYRRIGDTGPLLGVTTTGLSKLLTGLTGDQYQVQVRAYDSTGVGALSPIQIVTVKVPLPGKVTGLVSSGVTATSVLLRWTATAGADDYLVTWYRSGSLTETFRVTGTSSLRISGLDVQGLYTFYVRARNLTGSGVISDPLIVQLTNDALLTTGLTMTTLDAISADLTWTPPAGQVAYYELQVSQALMPPPGYVVLTSNDASTTLDLTAYAEVDPISVRVRPRFTDSTFGPLSAPAIFIRPAVEAPDGPGTPTDPDVPTDPDIPVDPPDPPVLTTVPGPVLGAVFTKDDALRKVTMLWTAPSFDGGSPLLGIRVGRDGVDASGNPAYSTLLPADATTFALTNLQPGNTYKASIAAVNALGDSVPVTFTFTVGVTSTTATQKTGAGIVRIQDLAGASLQAKLTAGKGSIISLALAPYVARDFKAPYGASPPYDAAITIPTGVKGVLGASPETSSLEIAPNSSTLNARVDPMVQDGKTPLYVQLMAIMQPPVGFRLEDVKILGTRQNPSTANADQGHNYNGVYFADPVGNFTIKNVLVKGVPGDWSSPPGETFCFSIYKQKAGTVGTVEKLKIDGTNELGVKVASAGLGLNRIDGRLEINDFDCRDTRYSAGIAAWRTGPASVVMIRRSRMYGIRRTLGAEAHAGIIVVEDPLWGDVQPTRYDINLTWAVVSGGVIYKNGKIEFRFSSTAAWNAFKAGRPLKHSNGGRPGMIRVVTSTTDDYGYGLIPRGAAGGMLDPWKCVSVYIAGVLQPVANHVDFFGNHGI